MRNQDFLFVHNVITYSSVCTYIIATSLLLNKVVFLQSYIFLQFIDEGKDDFPEIDRISLYTLRIYGILSIPMLLSSSYTLSYVFTAGTVSYRFVLDLCFDQTFFIFTLYL